MIPLGQCSFKELRLIYAFQKEKAVLVNLYFCKNQKSKQNSLTRTGIRHGIQAISL